MNSPRAGIQSGGPQLGFELDRPADASSCSHSTNGFAYGGFLRTFGKPQFWPTRGSSSLRGTTAAVRVPI